jgi:dipeptidyl-peptidase 4
LEDQISCLKQLADINLCDLNRVGITGWSYGGYLSSMALVKYPDVFKVGVAGAPVTSWDGYDTAYTERYMGTPQNNARGYHDGSVMTHANNLRGKLLLVHGMVDENVHFRHTARLVDTLIQCGKPHDLLILPDERHGPRRIQSRQYLEQRTIQYFIDNL